MMRNNCRLAPVINDHLSIKEASGEFSSDHRKPVKMAAINQQVTSRSISSAGE
jgi:hypothetical protein